jgi:RNA polymerase sigma-70 factor (ECF subfamily)
MGAEWRQAPEQRSVRLGASTFPGMAPFQQSATGDVTSLLHLWREGDDGAFDRLIPIVYDELHRMAVRYLAGERAHVSLEATGLVNEVCVRLLGWDQARWQNRQHFFGVSAQMMRRVLVDIARRRAADRRGGPGAVRVPLDLVDVPVPPIDLDLVAMDRALDQLAVRDARKARVVELRFFGGLSMQETATTLGISLRTAKSDWAFARAWLFQAMTQGNVE